MKFIGQILYEIHGHCQGGKKASEEADALIL